jgi:UDP-N-acetylglucosamine transferase subunit ALG13
MPNTTWTAYMAFDDLVKTMHDARSVVCHAGVGTIVTAIRAGHTPVVIPRQPGLGEHVDNHQMDIAERYAERGLVRCMTSGTNLAPLLAPRSENPSQMAGTGSEELRSAIFEAVTRGPRRRLANIHLP